MATIRIKFYTIEMDNGEKFWLTGKSKRDIARRYCAPSIPIKKISIGADTLHLRHIAEFNINPVSQP